MPGNPLLAGKSTGRGNNSSGVNGADNGTCVYYSRPGCTNSADT